MSRVFVSKSETLCRRSLLNPTSFRQQRQQSIIGSPRYHLATTNNAPSSSSSSSSLEQPQKRWMGHTVRLIAMEDLPHGKAYKGDVVKVKAGYARNHLVPQKLALYATPQNFERLGMVDPDYETEEQRISRLERELNMTASEDKYLKEADLLKRYLKNKVLQIWRMVDPNSTDTLHPGVVTTENLREKLSKQLKIDLDENEAMHIFRNDDDNNNNTDSSDSSAANTATTTTTTPINFAEIDEVKIQAMIDDFIPTTDQCPIKINRLGDYLAVIGLKGGYTVPLRFVVRQRAA